MPNTMEHLTHKYLGIPIQDWLIAAAVFIGSALVLLLLRRILGHLLRKAAERTSNDFDDVLAALIPETKILALIILSLFLGLQFISAPQKYITIANTVLLVTALLQTGLWGNKLVGYSIEKYFHIRESEDSSARGKVGILNILGRGFLWLVITLLVFDNLGFDVTALMTGLGIGGIAIALAVQTILADLFASLSIILDKPFVVGDFVRVDQYAGTIEHIGLKTTRLRSLTGEQLVISNADLLKSRIQNFKRMEERRILVTVGVVYQTPLDLLSRIPSMLKDVVEREELIRFDRAHFRDFGQSSLIFELVYFVQSPDYVVAMDIQQRINLGIFERFLESGVSFAFPTQTVFLHPEPPGA